MESCEMIKDLMENMGRLGLTAVDVDFPDGLKVSLKKEGQLAGAGSAMDFASVNSFGNVSNADNMGVNIGNVNNISSVQRTAEWGNNANGVINCNMEGNGSEDVGGVSLNIIRSPMVGTFYLKPAPTSEPYVKIGDKVSVGQTVCIVEAMKLMNEIESEFDGEICEIYVKDGEVVEYGTPLFGVK